MRTNFGSQLALPYQIRSYDIEFVSEFDSPSISYHTMRIPKCGEIKDPVGLCVSDRAEVDIESLLYISEKNSFTGWLVNLC